MKLQVIRTQLGKDATNGLLFINGVFECYTLEDQYQVEKVMHETCIPEGKYEIKFRTTGGFHTRYAARYGTAHHGMLHLHLMVLIYSQMYYLYIVLNSSYKTLDQTNYVSFIFQSYL